MEGFTLVEALITALGYAGAMVAAGTALFALSFPAMPPDARRMLRALGPTAGVLGALAAVALLPVQAAFLGGGWEAARDPFLVGLVWEGPQGDATALRLIGLTLAAAVALPWTAARWFAALGAVLVAASFAQAGHTLDSPRALLATLLTLHVLGVAFWVGALAPLHRVTGREAPPVAGMLLARFGRIAAVVVGGLVRAGLALAWLLTGGLAGLFTTPHGQGLLVKIVLVAGLLGMAVLNKYRLTPAVASGSAAAKRRLRASIRAEMALVGAIMLVTAGITTFTGPGSAG